MDLDTEEAVDDAIRQLTLTRDALHDFNQSVGIFLKSSSSISSVLKSTENKLDSGRSKSRSDMKKAKRIFAQAKKDLKSVSKGIRKRTDQLSATIAALDEVAQALKQPIDEQQRQKLIDAVGVLQIFSGILNPIDHKIQDVRGKFGCLRASLVRNQ